MFVINMIFVFALGLAFIFTAYKIGHYFLKEKPQKKKKEKKQELTEAEDYVSEDDKNLTREITRAYSNYLFELAEIEKQKRLALEAEKLQKKKNDVENNPDLWERVLIENRDMMFDLRGYGACSGFSAIGNYNYNPIGGYDEMFIKKDSAEYELYKTSNICLDFHNADNVLYIRFIPSNTRARDIHTITGSGCVFRPSH